MAITLGAGHLPLAQPNSATHTPLLPMAIAGLAIFLKFYVLSAYAIVITFGSLLLIPTYLLGRDFFNKSVGQMAVGCFPTFRGLLFASL